MKDIYTLVVLSLFIGFSLQAQTVNNLGDVVFSEDFGTIPPVAEWSAENGDNSVYMDPRTYRKRDNRSPYTFLSYVRRGDTEVYALNSSKPADKPTGTSGDWKMNNYTKPWINAPNVFTTYANQPQYIWCRVDKGVLGGGVSYTMTDNAYTDGKEVSDCDGGVNVRWINNGGWKLGYWYITSKTERGNWLDIGKYAVGANFYQIGEDDWEDVAADRSGDPDGLALMVNSAKNTGTFFTVPVSGLLPGIPYQFSLFVKNPDTKGTYPGLIGDLFPSNKTKPNLTIKVNENTAYTTSSGQLEFGDLTWHELAMDFIVPDNTNTVNVSLSFASPDDKRGNGLGIDDITVRPYLFDAGSFTADVCTSYGSVILTSTAKSLLANTTLYARWAQRDKATGTWSWLGNAARDSVHTVTAADFGKYDYRIVRSYSAYMLNNMTIGQSEAASNSIYQQSATIEGVKLPTFSLLSANAACEAGASVNNTYDEVKLNLSGVITSFSYKVGTDGEEIPALSPPEGEFPIEGFSAPENTKIIIAKAQFQGCEAVGVDSLPLPFKPKANVSGLAIKNGVFQGDELVLTATQSTAFTDADFKWYDSEDFTQTPISQGLTYRVTGDALGEYPLYLTEEGAGRCPFVRKISFEVLPLPELDELHDITLKLSEAFAVNFGGVKNISHYRVKLVSASMPGFMFSEKQGTILAGNDLKARLELIQGNSVLLAMPEMSGHTFTFNLAFWEETTINGTVYKKPIEKEVTFTVIPEPGIYLASSGTLCAGSDLTVVPMIGGEASLITSYKWYMDKLLVSEDPVLTLANLSKAHHNKTIVLKITYPGGESSSNDYKLGILDTDDNTITANDAVVLLRRRITLEGNIPGQPDVSYQWQQRFSGGSWEDVKGETFANLNTTLTESAKFRRRVSAGTCRLPSNELFIEAFNNDDNRIDYNEDVQVAPHTPVLVNGSRMDFNKQTAYQWQSKQEDGSWADIEGAIGVNFDFAPETTTIVRRMVSVDNCLDNSSNSRIVSVYNSAKENEIFYSGSLCLPGTTVKISGSAPDKTDCTYQWITKAEPAGRWTTVNGAVSRNLSHVLAAPAQFARVITFTDHSETFIDTSNVISVAIYDNSVNTISGVSSICRYNETDISGSRMDYPDLSFQWQVSKDGEVWDYMDGNSQNLRTNVSENSWYRRTVNVGGLVNNKSNSLRISIVDFSRDNILPEVPILTPGTEYTLEGIVLYGVKCQWQESEDGSTWKDLPGETAPSLTITAGDTERTVYYRRGLIPDSECDNINPWSNAVTVIVANLPKVNVIHALPSAVCPGSSFEITGNEKADALYTWKSSTDGLAWFVVPLAKDQYLNLEGGVNTPTLFVREMILNKTLYRSNTVVVNVYDLNHINNALEAKSNVCQGASISMGDREMEHPSVGLLPLPDNFPAADDLADDAIASIHWERSTTGQTGTWEELAGSENIVVDSVMETYKYRRVLTLKNGLKHLSNEVAPGIHPTPDMKIYTDAPLDKLNVSAPIQVHVTPDYLPAYTFTVNGKATTQSSAVLDAHNWIVSAENIIEVSVRTEQGCQVKQTLRFKGPDVDLPNVITPNGDGKNDILLPGYELIVFNRLGSTLYQGNEGWNGKFRGRQVEIGTYFYVVRIPMPDGSLKEYKSTVSVLN